MRISRAFLAVAAFLRPGTASGYNQPIHRADRCRPSERDECCDQDPSADYDSRAGHCAALGCNIKKCDKRDSSSGDDPALSIVELVGADDDLSLLAQAVAATPDVVNVLSGPGPLTLFAPNNAAFEALGPDAVEDLIADPERLAAILSYHVVEGAFAAADLETGQLTTLNGAKVDISVGDDGAVAVNDASVVEANIMASNGVVHIIDVVLMPPIDDDDEWAGDSHPDPTSQPTPEPTPEPTKNKCKQAERDACCSQGDETDRETQEEVCDLLGCNLKKCGKKRKSGGDEIPIWGGDAWASASPTSSPAWGGDAWGRSPTGHPTDHPTDKPSWKPSYRPTKSPTGHPTAHPTDKPSWKPSYRPTKNPTAHPTDKPSWKPSYRPTKNPTAQPTAHPTDKPSWKPSYRPTKNPTAHPTDKPSWKPSKAPSWGSTPKPSAHPTDTPTGHPTKSPSWGSTPKPSHSPSYSPNKAPTWSGASVPRCLDDELEVCCGQDQKRRSFRERKEVCRYLGCHIRMCYETKRKNKKPTEGPTTSPTTAKPYSKPSYSKPSYSKPSYSKPSTSSPTTSKPYSKPSYSKPSYSKPSTSSPTTSKPYSKPSYSKPSYSKPSYSKPSSTSPTESPTKRPAEENGYSKPTGGGYGSGPDPTHSPTKQPINGGTGYGSGAHPSMVQDLSKVFDANKNPLVPGGGHSDSDDGNGDDGGNSDNEDGDKGDEDPIIVVDHFHTTEHEECTEGVTDRNGGCVEECTRTEIIFMGSVEMDRTVTQFKRACGGGLTRKQRMKLDLAAEPGSEASGDETEDGLTRKQRMKLELKGGD